MELSVARRFRAATLVSLSLAAFQPADAAIGRTRGAASVTPDGEAGYSIPIVVPPGTNGMTPALSLEYRLRSLGGLLGVGWSIDGLSRIARCPRTVAQDGINAPVSWTTADKFCLDGQRLVVVNGVAYGAPGAEYRTEIESFARIRSYAGAGPAPQYFVVESADGRVLEYGATADSRIDASAALNPPNVALAWALNRIRDRSGNVIDFQYVEETSTATSRIARIRYNANPGAGIAASHEIVFIYENRPSNEIDTGHVAGAPIRQVVRLDQIDVLYNGAVLRRYDLVYEPALTATGQSRLASVKECGAGGTDCLAATTFSWQNGVPGYSAPFINNPAIAGPAYFAEGNQWNIADFNGDGRADQFWVGGFSMQTATIRIRFGQGDGSFGPEIDSGIACPWGLGQPFDYNADGRSDLLAASAAFQWIIHPGTAAGLGATIQTGISLPAQMPDFRGADLNGDGLGDIVWSEIPEYTGNSLAVFVRYALPGGGFSTIPAKLYDQAEAVGYDWPQGGTFIGKPGERTDFDGDGAEELLMNENFTIARISAAMYATDYFDGSFAGGMTFDMNGDGCADFIYLHYTNRLRVRIGGCGVAWSGPELQGPAWSGSTAFRAHDWNSDGRDDLLLRGATNWQVAVSTGSSLAPIVDTGIPLAGLTEVVSQDVNGDGLRDLIARHGNQIRLHRRNGPKADLLLAAVDGFGVSAAYSYRPLTDAAVFARGPDAPFPDQTQQTAALVVSELAASDGSGTGALAVTRHRYEGLRQNLQGRGSLGFAKHIATDLTQPQPTSIEIARRQDYPFTGLPQSIVLRQANGTLIAETSTTWSQLTIGAGAALRRLPYASQVTRRHREAGGIHDGIETATITQTVNAIDAASGLVTDATTTITEVSSGIHAGSTSTLRTVHVGVLNDSTNWCLGRPQSTQLTANHTLAGGAPITRSFDQTWDAAKCRPVQLRREPGSSQLQVAVNLGYDAFGNPASRSAVGAGMSARTTTINWDSRGQLPANVTNALGQSLSMTWDPGMGLPRTLTDPNTLTTNWSYDAFGGILQEVLPDGTSTSWSRSTCTGACDARSRFQVTQRDKDSGGAVQVTTVADVDQHNRAFRIAAQQPAGGMSVLAFESDARGRESRRYLPFWQGGVAPGYLQFTYDLLDRTAGVALHASGGNIEQSHAIRHDGLAVTHVDALGRSTTAMRTAWGALAQITDAASGNTRYETDAFSNLLRVFDALNNPIETIGYNARGMKVSQTGTDAGAWTYVRNALGEILSVQDAKAQTIGFTYDALGRLTSRVAPDGTSTLTWGMTAANRDVGQLIGMAGPGYSESLAYDQLGRPVTRTIVADASYRYDYTYNAFGLLDTLTYPDTGSGNRFKLGYEYDAGWPVRIKDAANPITSFWRLQAQDAAGNSIDESLGSAIRVVSGFDPVTGAIDYRRASVGSATRQDLSYAWDDNGNLTKRQDLRQGLIEEFRYDTLDRLDDSRRNGVVNLDLSYDDIGNIRWKSDVCPTASPCYSYDAIRKHAVTAAGAQSYGYDANGNMVSRSGASIAWTSSNLPKSIASPGGNSSQFSYGPFGNRWKQVATHAGVAETTIYAGELMEKVTREGVTAWRHYVVAPTGTAAIQLRYSNGAPAATRFLTHDHLGSVDRILDAAGNAVATESFAPFGKRRGAKWTGLPKAAELATIGAITRDGFTGHEHLDNLGLIHMNGRVYDPHIGRFLSADPYVTEPLSGQGFNRYAYVTNNPLSFVDPSGFQAQPPCLEAPSGACARVTVYGDRSPTVYRYLGGGSAQVESASQRDPCGRDSDAYTCATHGIQWVRPSEIVLTVGTKTDPLLNRNAELDRLHGFAARAGNLVLSSSPLSWLFGAESDFEWFEIPDSYEGRSGASIGNVGYLIGGAAGTIRSGVTRVGAAATQRGVTVLGHHPEYLAKASELGSRRFDMPREIRARMTSAEKWAANQKFLDRLVARGDDVVLATRAELAKAGSTLEREIQYLLGRGYQIVDDGWRMILGE